jgi:hypothetical protein
MRRKIITVRAATTPDHVARLNIDELRIHCRLFHLPFDDRAPHAARVALLKFLFPNAPHLRPRRRINLARPSARPGIRRDK